MCISVKRKCISVFFYLNIMTEQQTKATRILTARVSVTDNDETITSKHNLKPKHVTSIVVISRRIIRDSLELFCIAIIKLVNISSSDLIACRV